MKTFLNVPFKEKDHAKALGARWDAALSTWYVPDGVDLTPFLRWVPSLPKLSKAIKRALRRPSSERTKGTR